MASVRGRNWASGAIFGLAGALIAALYLGKLPIPKEAIQSTMKSLLTFTAYNLFFGLSRGIDHAAHLGGLISGLALGAFRSKHLTESAEVRLQWRNYALVFSLLLLSAGMYYVRHQHREFTAIANPTTMWPSTERRWMRSAKKTMRTPFRRARGWFS